MSQRRRDTLPKNKSNVAGGTASQRRVSRREREDKQRRQLYIGLAVAALLSVAILGGFALNEYFIKPRAVLASVNGVDIRRRDYWKVRSVDLVNQVNQYNQFSQMVDATQQQQYITLAQQAADELDGVWGSTEIDDATLTRMVEDQIYIQSLDDLGLTVTDQDMENYLNSQFEPSNAPIFTPTPSPTLIPQRADWATQTEVALRAEGEEPTEVAESTLTPDGSPIIDATPLGSPVSESSPISGSPEVAVSPDASPILVGSPVIEAPATTGSPIVVASLESSSPDAAGSPESSPFVAASPVNGSSVVDASPVDGSPEAVGSPVSDASPVGSPVAEATSTTIDVPTPNPTEAVQTAEAGYGDYKDVVFDIAHMSDSDYMRLVVRPAVARQTVDDFLLKDVGQSTAQVHASHILVDTKDLADSIYAQLQGGADFAQTAMAQSNDTATAENGGDLGWFTKGQMVEPFENVAFSLQPGQYSEPFQTQYGWHIVLVTETDPNRAMTDQQLTQYRESILSRWMTQQKESMDISSKVVPTPTPALSSFVPPPDAPALPTPTPEPTQPTVDGSPIASPIGSPNASPVGSPIASPAT